MNELLCACEYIFRQKLTNPGYIGSRRNGLVKVSVFWLLRGYDRLFAEIHNLFERIPQWSGAFSDTFKYQHKVIYIADFSLKKLLAFSEKLSVVEQLIQLVDL